MHHWICRTCGVQHPVSSEPPAICEICADPRQYVSPNGQEWTSLAQLQQGHSNGISEMESGLWSIHTEPKFAIGQRAYLVQTADGNILWDCISLLDDATEQFVRSTGGLKAIAISHPHYYSTMAEWSRVFGDVPVWIHEYDREWLRRRDFNLKVWSGSKHSISSEFTLVRSGGHFAGYQVGLWTRGAAGQGVLFAGDQPQVCPDTRWVSFMYSYPNWIPFDAETVESITQSLQGLVYDRIYGAFGYNVLSGAKEAVDRSKARYLEALSPSRNPSE